MGSYEESSDAQLIALTRLRRAERRATLVEQTPCLRIAAEHRSTEFRLHIAEPSSSANRSKARMQAWRRRMWKAGVRACRYCREQLTKIPRFGTPPPTSVTVDHVVPLSDNGLDDPSNYAMCCSRCNNRKGSMSEAEYLAVLSGGLG